MAAIRDSGYPRNTAGNVQTDFVFGPFPAQTNDDRSGTATDYKTPSAYNATGGGTGDKAWGTTTDFVSAPITTSNISVVNGPLTLTVNPDNHVNVINGWDNYPNYTNPGKAGTGYNPAGYLYGVVTAVSGNGTTVTVTANNNFTNGQSVTLSGLYNYVTAGSNQPISTQYYAKTYTTASNFNITGTVANATATGFTIANSATDSALSGVNGLATVTIAASASTASVPVITGLTEAEADRLINNADLDNGTTTYVTAGATDVDLVATGITAASAAGTTATVTAASATGGVVTYTATNTFVVGQTVSITGLSTTAFNLTSVTIATASGSQFTVVNSATGTAVTGASATATGVATVSYTVNNTFTAGQVVNIFGLSTAAFNLTGVTISYATPTGFLVANAASGTAVSGASTTPVVLSGATAAISGTNTYTYTVANSLVAGQIVSISGFASANYNLVNATVATASGTQFTVTGSGLTNGTAVGTGTVVANPAIARVPANAKTIKSYTPTGTQTSGTAINITVWRKLSGANAGTQDGTFTY